MHAVENKSVQYSVKGSFLFVHIETTIFQSLRVDVKAWEYSLSVIMQTFASPWLVALQGFWYFTQFMYVWLKESMASALKQFYCFSLIVMMMHCLREELYGQPHAS